MPEFLVFDPTHLLALGVTALGVVGSVVFRRPLSAPEVNRRVRYALAAALLLNELLFQVFEVWTGHWSLGFSLRIHYCQLATFLLAFVLVTLSEKPFQIAYYWLMTGMLHGLITPNLKPEDPPHVVVDFFVYHGLTLVGLAFLLATTRLRPTWKGLWFTVGVGLLLMPLIGLVDWALGVNYWFLREKPYGENLTSVMPDWPWYVLLFVPVAILHYIAVYLPFAIAGRRRGGSGGTAA